MSEIVELLRNTKKEKSSVPKTLDKSMTRLIVVISMVAVIFLIVGYLIFSSIYLKRLYWDYVSELSNSTVYSYEHDGITITDSDSETAYIVDGNSVYLFYKKFSNGEFREVNKNINSELGCLHMEFGNGSSLDVWEVEKGTSSKDLLYLEYQNTKGRIYKCNVEGVQLDSIREFLVGI